MKKIAMLTAITLMSGSALADNQAGQILLNPALSYQKFDNKRDLDDATGFGLGVEYRFGPHWAVEAAGFQSKGDIDLPSVNEEFKLNQYKIDGLYYLTESGSVQPYLGAGVGRGEFDQGIDDETQLNLGGGLRFNIDDAWSARWDLRGVHGLDDDRTDLMTTFGISYTFGAAPAKKMEPKPEPAPMVVKKDTDNDGVLDSVDQCPSTPAGVTVNAKGCEKDSDGDGVVDSKDQCSGTAAGAAVDEKGCVGVTQTVTVESIELSIQFPTNSDVIPAKYDPELQKVAEFLKRYTDLTVEIEGHTDSSGKASYNKKLSQTRADSVRERLVNQFGIAGDRITAMGYGEEKPVASNDTEEGRSTNRRVVAVMQKEVIQ